MFGEIYVKPVNIDIFSIKFTLTLWENIALDKVHLCLIKGLFVSGNYFSACTEDLLLWLLKHPKVGHGVLTY